MAAAVEMTRDVVHADDKVIVLHVHEFAVGRFGRIQVDCADGQGESLVDGIVADLTESGLSAEGIIKEADFGHVARAILAVADHCQARLLVLGSSSRTDLPGFRSAAWPTGCCTSRRCRSSSCRCGVTLRSACLRQQPSRPRLPSRPDASPRRAESCHCQHWRHQRRVAAGQ